MVPRAGSDKLLSIALGAELSEHKVPQLTFHVLSPGEVFVCVTVKLGDDPFTQGVDVAGFNERLLCWAKASKFETKKHITAMQQITNVFFLKTVLWISDTIAIQIKGFVV